MFDPPTAETSTSPLYLFATRCVDDRTVAERRSCCLLVFGHKMCQVIQGYWLAQQVFYSRFSAPGCQAGGVIGGTECNQWAAILFAVPFVIASQVGVQLTSLG